MRSATPIDNLVFWFVTLAGVAFWAAVITMVLE
jgi:hypothetical protein